MIFIIGEFRSYKWAYDGEKTGTRMRPLFSLWSSRCELIIGYQRCNVVQRFELHLHNPLQLNNIVLDHIQFSRVRNLSLKVNHFFFHSLSLEFLIEERKKRGRSKYILLNLLFTGTKLHSIKTVPVPGFTCGFLCYFLIHIIRHEMKPQTGQL